MNNQPEPNWNAFENSREYKDARTWEKGIGFFAIACIIIASLLLLAVPAFSQDEQKPLPQWTLPIAELLKSNPSAVLDGLDTLAEDSATTGSQTFGRIDTSKVVAMRFLLDEGVRIPTRHGTEERYIREVLVFLDGPAATLIEEDNRNLAVQFVVMWSRQQLSDRAQYLASIASAR